jgi:hypothetical protein
MGGVNNSLGEKCLNFLDGILNVGDWVDWEDKGAGREKMPC